MADNNLAENKNVAQFIEHVRWLYEPEYGDFKRKVGLYIQRLEEATPSLKSGAAQKILDSMRTTVLFDPNGDIEGTRRKILRLAMELTGQSSGQIH